MIQRPIIILSGPTATGKTSLSLEIANKFGAEIVNFDSLLFYKELNIGVAKPSLEELNSAPHHFISINSITTPLNAHLFSEMAIAKINELHKEGKIIVLVGGSGFYLQAVLQGMFDSPTVPNEVIKKSEQIYKSDGIEPFLKTLKQHDPQSLARYHQNDHYRIRRAVEHFWAWGTPFSEVRESKDESNLSQTEWPVNKYHWNLLNCYLDIPKAEHLKIIESRTRNMIQQGLEQEVSQLLLNFDTNLKPLNSIGYKEMIQYLNGHINSISDCIERINISTRQLAKAQRTWFKKREKLSFNPLTDKERLLGIIREFLMGK